MNNNDYFNLQEAINIKIAKRMENKCLILNTSLKN